MCQRTQHQLGGDDCTPAMPSRCSWRLVRLSCLTHRRMRLPRWSAGFQGGEEGSLCNARATVDTFLHRSLAMALPACC